MMSAWKRIALVLIALVLAAAAVFYRLVLPGLSSARNEPPALETSVATWLLRHSVPPEARAVANPRGDDPAAVAAGRDLFREKCESCHAYDGSGKTEIG